MKYERKDAHYRRAKAEGFRARSSYKLADLDDRHQLLKKGDRVVDLGAWPGGWCQIAIERVGSAGRVIGVDVVAIDPLPALNVDLMVGDVRDPLLAAEITGRMGGLADVVLSDVAPKLTGVRDRDEALCAETLSAVIELLPRLLKPRGRALLKIFMDSAYRQHLAEIRKIFDELKTTRSAAARRGSAELYVVAIGFHSPISSCG